MCGITGIIGDVSEDKINVINNMIVAQSHRGPDGHRVLKTPTALLGFSRLKIIDFDDRSMQPMISKNKKYVLLFNGEIYNYKKLKADIGNKYKFNTTSDTEVLLAMLILYGLDSLKSINGMFSFCFYDVDKNLYTLVRDRYGQKPLYFSIEKGSFYFASEVKSLLAACIKSTPNYTSISDYLHKGKIDCDKDTLFKNVHQIKPGTYLQIRDSKVFSEYRWYNIESINKLKLPIDKKERYLYIADTLTEVCEEHLNSDTDIGVKLSGGLDSSTMLASMEKNKKYLSNSCFSVDFGNSLSEKEWIKNTADYFSKETNISHYKVDDFLDDFDRMIYTHEGPLGGLMNCAFEKIYRDANKQGIRVLLDGTGLDEAFGGYRIHHLLYLNRLFNSNNEEFDLHCKYYSEKWNIKISEVKTELKNLQNINPSVQDGSTYDQTLYTSNYIQSMQKPPIHKEPSNLDNLSKH